MKSGKSKAWSDENLVDPIGMFRKFHNELKWEALALDSTDNIIRGARIEFEWGTSSLNFTYDFETTGADGYARGAISTPDCQGDFEIDRTDIATGHMWHIEFDPGVVRWRSVDSPDVTVGHGSTILNAYHTCDENLMFTDQHMSSGGSCSGSTVFCPADYITAPSPNPSRVFTDSSLMWKHRGHSQTLPTFNPTPP